MHGMRYRWPGRSIQRAPRVRPRNGGRSARGRLAPRVDPASGPGLGKCRLEVVLHCVGRDVESARDLLGGQASEAQTGDVALALGQPVGLRDQGGDLEGAGGLHDDRNTAVERAGQSGGVVEQPLARLGLHPRPRRSAVGCAGGAWRARVATACTTRVSWGWGAGGISTTSSSQRSARGEIDSTLTCGSSTTTPGTVSRLSWSSTSETSTARRNPSAVPKHSLPLSASTRVGDFAWTRTGSLLTAGPDDPVFAMTKLASLPIAAVTVGAIIQRRSPPMRRSPRFLPALRPPIRCACYAERRRPSEGSPVLVKWTRLRPVRQQATRPPERGGLLGTRCPARARRTRRC